MTPQEHVKLMQEKYPEEIQISQEEYQGYDDSLINPGIMIYPGDCLSAAIYSSNHFKYSEEEITILNFASFKYPGGGYLKGATAQEESLCAESTLYNVLSDPWLEETYYSKNREDINKGLYYNKALYHPEIVFERDDKTYKFNILTCAAPNYGEAIKRGVPHSEIVEIYRNRLKFIYKILAQKQQGLLIAGAWGCGVFRFPLDISKQLFKEEAIIDTILAYPNAKEIQFI